MSAKRVFFGVLQKIMVICSAIFFGFANAFSANLPSGYTELEYIKTTGTQYINTGINNTGSIGFETEVSADIYGRELGLIATSTSSSGPHYVMQAHSGSLKFYWANGSGPIIFTDDHNMHHVSFNTTGDTKAYTDGTLVGTITSGLFPTDINYPFYLFARDVAGRLKSDSAGQFTCKYFKIYRDGNLIAHFVPAKNSSGVIGMYDTVSGTFFTNQGTGEFIAGPEVSIRIATTAYNTARFNSVQTDLNNAVATIRDIVTKTINQTAAIASLQADKQTRPEDACPAGKKCLLVETEENGVIVPHWFPIIEAPEE
ncbi:MAG: hypothetical protein IJU89_01170 [Alphaproteobacteria bacterium]|nr:hypothetical protein [Alphaproteobacteria bacterium]